MRSRVGRSGGRTRASSSGSAPWVKKKKAGSRLAGAGSRRRAGGAGTHAGASTRRRSGTRICTDENVCPSRRTGCSRAGNPRPCRCRPRRPTSSRCVYSPSPSKKNCSLAHAGALCPPATRRFESRLFSREVSLTPESAALHAPRGRHRGLPSSPKTDERDDARLEKERTRLTRRARDWPTFRDRSRRKNLRSSASAPRAVTRYEYARSRRDCGVERTRS